MAAFRYATIASHVRFGSGGFSNLAEEADRLGLARLLLLTTPQQVELADRATAYLGTRAAARFTDATMHTSVAITERALEIVRGHRIDGLVALGGGSTIGLGKALALRTGLPQIAMPTTYAGSEMTPILGQTEKGQKTTLRNPAIQPATTMRRPAVRMLIACDLPLDPPA
jgi:alcohol dehydrogenase class IV